MKQRPWSMECSYPSLNVTEKKKNWKIESREERIITKERYRCISVMFLTRLMPESVGKDFTFRYMYWYSGYQNRKWRFWQLNAHIKFDAVKRKISISRLTDSHEFPNRFISEITREVYRKSYHLGGNYHYKFFRAEIKVKWNGALRRIYIPY